LPCDKTELETAILNFHLKFVKFEGKIAKWIRIVSVPTQNRKWLTSVTSVLSGAQRAEIDFLRLDFPKRLPLIVVITNLIGQLDVEHLLVIAMKLHHDIAV
jgi:hypothetical protein